MARGFEAAATRQKRSLMVESGGGVMSGVRSTDRLELRPTESVTAPGSSSDPYRRIARGRAPDHKSLCSARFRVKLPCQRYAVGHPENGRFCGKITPAKRT